jgi:fructose-1-phosphate kinase PfkB-like protein
VDEALRSAVAAGSASVLEAGAGRFDPKEVGRLASHVEVERLARVTQDA